MRKKKDCLLAVLLAVCFLCGCSASVYLRSPEEPQIQFYYCVRESADAKTGGLTATPASVPDSSPAAVLQQYLIAPAAAKLFTSLICWVGSFKCYILITI